MLRSSSAAESGSPGRSVLVACRRDLREDPRQVVYLYRAVDREGRTVDFRLSGKRDVGAAKAFFRKAIKSQGSAPRTITLDGYAASHRAVREMKSGGSCRRTRRYAHRNI